MRIKLARILAFIFALSLMVALTISLGARGPQSQERPLPPRAGLPKGRLPSDIRTAAPAPSSWFRSYGKFFDTTDTEYDWYADSQPAWDGGVVVAGSASRIVTSPRKVIQDMLVMEIGPLGGVAWQVLYEADPDKDCYNDAEGLTRTRDGGYLVVGSVSQSPLSESAVLVMKLIPPPEPPDEGKTPYHHYSLGFGPEWVKSYRFSAQGQGYSYAGNVVETPDGGFVLSGYRSSPNGVSSNWLMKIDPAGNVVWHEDVALDRLSLIATSDAGFIVAGEADNRVQVVKFDSGGRVQWAKSYEEKDPGWGCDDYEFTLSSISSTADGGYILAGATIGCICCDHSRSAEWVCKLDRDGRIAWSQGYASPGIRSILQTTDGCYLMTVMEGLVKVDSSGSIQWVKAYSEVSPQSAFPFDGQGFMVAGSANLAASNYDLRLMVMRVDSGGHINPPCSLESDGSATTRNARVRYVSTSEFKPTENSVLVNVLEYTPFTRTCEVTTICPSGEDSQSRPSREPVCPSDDGRSNQNNQNLRGEVHGLFS